MNRRRLPSSFLVVLIFIFLIPAKVFAQGSSLHILVKNERGQAIPYASVGLNPSSDSTALTTRVADSSGLAAFAVRKNTSYTIRISAVNYQPVEKGIRFTGQDRLEIVLLPLSRTLRGVVVNSTRPLMRVEDDKTIVDPENLIPSSTSGYEVIEKTPGLFVDQDGNIYINSTTPATIYINGREMKMSTADIATMLKSLPPNAITRLEILRTPSAKYDASGAGGIVNVVLKKGVRLGMTGSATLGWQQGKYANTLAGFNLNNNNGKVTSFVNLNYSRRDSYERIKTDRLFAPDSLLGQDAYTRYPSSVYYLGYGLNLEQGKGWDFSYDGRISLNDFDNLTTNRSVIYKQSTGEVLTDNNASVRNKGASLLLTQGLSAKKKLDSIGSAWTTDVSYTFARNNTDQYFQTVFTQPTIPDIGGDGNGLNWRHLLTAQTDLSKKLQGGITLEAGLKTSLQQFKSRTNYFKDEGGGRTKDAGRTNTFQYGEQVHALYLQGSKTIDEIVLKAGIRMENTNMEGHQRIPSDTSFRIHRTDLFPYVYLSRKVITIAGFDLRAYLVYRRTISRPVYEQLNPFPRYVDPYLSEVGNPALRPQFTQNYEANISVDQTPLLAVGINDTKDIFTNVIYQSESSQRQAFRTYDNLGRNKEFYIRGLGAIPPGKRYFFVVGGQYNHNAYRGIYENQPLIFNKGSWTFFTYHTLKVGRGTQLTVNGFIRLKGQLQFYELGPFGALNASINQQFFKQRLIVTLSGNDIFATNRNDFVIQQGSVNASGYRLGDTRRFGINLRYNFGMRRKEAAADIFKVSEPD